jgi:hypothetical protein
LSRADVVKPGVSPSNRYWTILVLLAIVELLWLGWVLNTPLPNAKLPDGGQLNRSFFLWRLLPEAVPGVKWQESYLGLAVKELSHVENLPQRGPIVLAAGFILVSGIALGRLVLRALGLLRLWSSLERLATSYGLGMTGLGLFALILGRIGLLTPWTARVGLLIPILVETGFLVRQAWVHPGVTTNPSSLEGEGRVGGEAATGVKNPPTYPLPQGGRDGAPSGSWAHPGGEASPLSIVGLGLIVTPFLILMALGAMLPTIDFDAIEYHLGAPKEYFLDGKISFLPHNVYASMPFSIEMLHLLGMHVMNDWWWGALVGQLLNASFAPMAGLAIWLTARRWGSPRAAWVAVAVYLTTPWILRLAAIPYVEGPLCYYHAALVWAAGVAWASPAFCRGRAWAVVGLIAGGAMAIKYPALISAVAPMGLVALTAAWRARSPRLVLSFGIGVAIVMGPWLLKNFLDTGNPVYPLGFRVFGGRDWDQAREAKWVNVHGPRPIEAKEFVSSTIDVAGRSDWQSPAFMALVPLAFLRRESRRVALAIGEYVLYLFLTWWLLTHRLDRFWLPLLPGLAVLAGFGADWTRGKAWTALLGLVLTVSIASNFAYSTTALVGLNQWTGDLRALRTEVPRMVNPPLARLDAELPQGAKPLFVGQAQGFHMAHRVVYNTVFDRETFETIDRDHSTEEVRADLKRRGITHIYVDWADIERYRSPGNYGFTDYVTLPRFDRLVDAGVLSKPRVIGSKQDLYTVLAPK